MTDENLTMAADNVNPDLQRERTKTTFNVELLTNLIDGGEDATETRRQIIRKALKEPIFTDGPPSCFLSREELYDRAVQKTVLMKKLTAEWKLSLLDGLTLAMIAFPNETEPDSIHRVFVPTIYNQATEEQKLRWQPMIKGGRLIGTYAQTEMGHGSNLRKLETTATYDHSKEEFILHSPTVSAMKWWPGGLGKTSNCAVVMAQLHLNGVNHGTCPFFVIFRDLDNHQPLPGVKVGDIGPKMGFNTIDNGFMKFDNFRIPRENMLMKHIEVTRDGRFLTKTTQKKPTYSSMTLVRTAIVRNFGYLPLAAGMTIAIRYSAVRRQSELEPGAPEPQILDYQTQQHKLFPYLAMAYAFKFAFDRLTNLFIEGMGELHSGNDSVMPELHAVSSGLKAYCTSTCMLGLEQGRLACGGHGYSEASGFPKIYTESVSAATAEGEVTVLYLQTARYLVKAVGQAARGEHLAPSVSFIAAKQSGRCRIDDKFRLEDLSDALEHRARRVAYAAAQGIQDDTARGVPEYDARNRSGVFLVRAAMAYCDYYIIKTFVDTVGDMDDPAIRNVMTQLCQLLALFQIRSKSGDYLEDGFMSRAQLQLVRSKEAALLADIRPNAVALVDAFDFPDHFLGSVLGRYDGQVYENLYKWALESPLNKNQVHESYYKYLQPMMKAKM